MIDVLIRVHNEAEWVPQLLKSLACQKDVELGQVLIVDNNSTDMPEIYFDRFPELNIRLERFEADYLPGKMLNFGINKLIQSKTSSNYLLIISAHCFLKKSSDLNYMKASMEATENCRAVFGRQVPMTISDAQAIRDLALLYPKESRVIEQAAAFNNAFSLIDYRALHDNLFDPEATNLEDVIWAQSELQSGYVVKYCADAEAVHYHGPHHVNVAERLKNTRTTIEKYADVFNSEASEPRIELTDICPIFVVTSLDTNTDRLCDLMLSYAQKHQVYLWANASDPLANRVRNIENIKIMERNYQSDQKETALFTHFPELWAAMRREGLSPDYIILFDGSFDPDYSVVTPQIAIDEIKKQFSPVIWPSKLNSNLIFRRNADGKFMANTTINNGKVEKTRDLEVLRGNGSIISFKYLNYINDLFNNAGFYLLEKSS
ncbi:glycosyltransferase family 2 protein [Alphaproteobacteria bacterium]|nr:glycosyltransferase family 2 protein [Alphaproteobacteria bacterium]MDB2626310.1 glycosyltransferase family 2 protein [Alphaproteobacteria bacterium]